MSDGPTDPSDFQASLRQRLERNEVLAKEREQMEAEEARRRQEERRAREAEREAFESARRDRHTELVERLTASARGLKEAASEAFIVRLGWTESRAEFIAKISTRLMEPARSLLIELDLHDDAVLARWNSDLGSALELWRLLEVQTEVMEQLVLQVADQESWQGSKPPAFPKTDG